MRTSHEISKISRTKPNERKRMIFSVIDFNEIKTIRMNPIYSSLFALCKCYRKQTPYGWNTDKVCVFFKSFECSLYGNEEKCVMPFPLLLTSISRLVASAHTHSHTHLSIIIIIIVIISFCGVRLHISFVFLCVPLLSTPSIQTLIINTKHINAMEYDCASDTVAVAATTTTTVVIFISAI